MTLPRLYRIKSCQGHFYAGFLRDGNPVFMSIHGYALLAIRFDAEGCLLKPLIKELSAETQAAFKEVVARRDLVNFDADWQELDKWAADLGFTAGTIAVQKCRLPEYNFGIQDLPGIYEELLTEGDDLVDDLDEQIACWREVNDFVLVWGNEYDIAEDGEVVST